MEDHITLSEAEQKTGVPARTIRRYIQKHGQYIPFEKQDRKYMIAEYALPMITKIRELYDQGMTVAQVDQKLDNDGDSMLVEVDRVTESSAMDGKKLKEFFQAVLNEHDKKLDQKVKQSEERILNQIQEEQRQIYNSNQLDHQKTRKKLEEEIANIEEIKKLNKTIEELRNEMKELKKPWWKKIFRKD
ncbi:MerR family transcriptional regulator (plasmid) [Natranaerobius thermophilus JW/NM-WN-LF]|nr:MerR family transcriptional regulator [Natranaerobius thermophilus]